MSDAAAPAPAPVPTTPAVEAPAAPAPEAPAAPAPPAPEVPAAPAAPAPASPAPVPAISPPASPPAPAAPAPPSPASSVVFVEAAAPVKEAAPLPPPVVPPPARASTMPVATKGKPLVQIVEETAPPLPAAPAPAVIVVPAAEAPVPAPKPVVSVIQTDAPVKVADKPITESVTVVKSEAPLKATKTVDFKDDKTEKKVEKEEKKIEKEEKKIEKEEKKAEKKVEKEEKKVVKEEKKLDKAVEKEETKKQKTIIVVAPEPVVVTEAKAAPKIAIPEPVKPKNKPVEVYEFDTPMRRRDRLRRGIYGLWLKLSRRSRSRDAYGRGEHRINDDVAHLKAVFEAKSSELNALRRRYQEALRSDFYQADAHTRDAKAAAYAAVERGRTRHRQTRDDEERDVLRDIARQRRDIRLSSQTRRGYEGELTIDVEEREALQAIARERRGTRLPSHKRGGFVEEIEIDNKDVKASDLECCICPSAKCKLHWKPKKTETKEQVEITVGPLNPYDGASQSTPRPKPPARFTNESLTYAGVKHPRSSSKGSSIVYLDPMPISDDSKSIFTSTSQKKPRLSDCHPFKNVMHRLQHRPSKHGLKSFLRREV